MWTRGPANRISTATKSRKTKWLMFSIRAKTVRGEKAREALSVGREQAGTCGLSTFQTQNQAVFS